MISSNDSSNLSTSPKSLSIHASSSPLNEKPWIQQQFITPPTTPLPFPPPLTREMFAIDNFDADTFLANRRHLTLDELKRELNGHLKSLKNVLVELINKDYSSFVDLSTNLKGVDKVIEEIASPLVKIREQVQGVRSTMQQVVNELESKLALRASIREKKAALQLLINIHESVRKVEVLLLINSENGSSLLSDNGSGGNAKQIERVAVEFNQMQYLVNRGQGLAFVENIDWRIKRIKETLRTNLTAALRSALQGIKNNSNYASSRDTLTQILRTYALIDQTAAAEEVIREELVAPFVAETASKQFLENPLTSTPSVMPSTLSFPAAKVLVSSKEPLAIMYSKILSFISNDCYVLIEITKKVLKSTSYEILVNSVWTEVVDTILKKLGVIFNAGNPNTFHKNYTISMGFVSGVESMCSSKKSLLYLRNHNSYVEYMKRWQLAVYFQLRFREISIQVEDVLGSGLELSATGFSNSAVFKFPASRTIMAAIQRCWADDIFIYGLSHRFWKLTLQLLQRYKHWILNAINELNDANLNKNNKDNTSSAVIADATDEQLLRLLTAVAFDIENIHDKVKLFYGDTILLKLPTLMADEPIIEDSITSPLITLRDTLLPDLTNQITTILTKQCSEILHHVRSITQQYRHTNKKAPTEASDFVPHIMKPLVTYTVANKAILTEKTRKTGSLIVAEAVATRLLWILKYCNRASELLTSLKKTEEALKRLKKGKSAKATATNTLFSSFLSDDSGMSDEDKIRLQILLDVKQFGKELMNLEIDPEQLEGYNELYKLVEPFGKYNTS
ncbi:9713_t:CDS:10 [Paraglomus brasilianum]|uniref:Conserved oligomeric Golgi complex subunit 2 n=1 Tax=Paraglomus brasilianum TaxID=144538 RepID=A0A9N8ZUG9_9GLOM|nr:9713_t:CDS:10 [Paraglomus brasilianum]